MGDWDSVTKEWLVDTGHCSCAGIASAEDGSVFAAAADDDDGWGKLTAEDHEEDVLQEDGETVEKVLMNEATTIKKAVDEGSVPEGVWIGGIKYKVVSVDRKFEYNDQEFDLILLAKTKGGCHLVKTAAGSIVIAIFDEEKDQSKGNSRQSALAFAEYLNSTGY